MPAASPEPKVATPFDGPPNKLCPLSKADMAAVVWAWKETGVLTMRDAESGFMFASGPDAHTLGRGFHPQAPKLIREDGSAEMGTDRAIQWRRDIERLHDPSGQFPDGIPIGCFRVWTRGNIGEEFKYTDCRYDITMEQREVLTHFVNGIPYMDANARKKDEIAKERARARIATAIVDPGQAGREAAIAAVEVMGPKIAQAVADGVRNAKGGA